MTPTASSAGPGRTRCRFALARGSDILFRRTTDLPSVPRVDDLVQVAIAGVGSVRGKVRSVRWIVPDDDEAVVVDVQVELGSADRRRFAGRVALSGDGPTDART